MNSKYRNDLILEKAEAYAHEIYKVAKKFPRDELFGLTSQLRRASLSVSLNIVEGYARQSQRSQTQFLKISYGSLKESQFILKFAFDENYISENEMQTAVRLGEEVGKLIWSKTQTLEKVNLK